MWPFLECHILQGSRSIWHFLEMNFSRTLTDEGPAVSCGGIVAVFDCELVCSL